MSTLEHMVEQMVEQISSPSSLKLRLEISTIPAHRTAATSACAAQIKELIKKLGREFKLTVAIRNELGGFEIDAILSALDGLDDSLYSWTASSSENMWVARIESKGSKMCGFGARWMYECDCCE